ncbi:MAG: hypothetical protein JO333_15745 [Verrucomicrobia bacterium]|nr:hypothetical protein [Verrucomicrobiota bacterium]
MKKSVVFAVVAILSQGITTFAGPTEVSGKKEVVPPPAPTSFFRAQELDLGAFATYATRFGPQSDNFGIGNHAWGGGVDVAYFPLLYAGFRVQGGLINIIPGSRTAGIIKGDFLIRYPLDLKWPNFHLAPYGIAGVGGLIGGYDGLSNTGAQHVASKVLGDFGGGLEYRFTPHIGVFGETTWNVVDGPKNNFLEVNWGVRLAFP